MNAEEFVSQSDELKVYVAAAAILVSSGIAWGVQLANVRGLRRRMTKAEKALESDGSFISKRECDMRNRHSDERFDTLQKQIADNKQDTDKKITDVKQDTAWLRDKIDKHIVRNNEPKSK